MKGLDAPKLCCVMALLGVRSGCDVCAQLLKNEPLKVTYSYWDGTGHRRQTVVRKGDTIGAFLAKVREQLSPDFRDLRCEL